MNYSSWGCTESDRTEGTSHARQSCCWGSDECSEPPALTPPNGQRHFWEFSGSLKWTANHCLWGSPRGPAMFPHEVKWKLFSCVWLFVTPRTVESMELLSRPDRRESRSNPVLPNCRQILYQLSHKGSPRRLDWVAYLPDPEIEPGLLHCRQILYQLSSQGSPYVPWLSVNACANTTLFKLLWHHSTLHSLDRTWLSLFLLKFFIAHFFIFLNET